MNSPHVGDSRMEALAEEVLRRAGRAGASDAEVVGHGGEEFKVRVRLGEVETVVESGSRSLGLRVFLGRRIGSTSTSDLSEGGLRRLVSSAIALASVAGEDPFSGLPERDELGQNDVAKQGLYFEDANGIPRLQCIEIAKRCEAAALTADSRIKNSRGANFHCGSTSRLLFNSRGFRGAYRSSTVSFSTAPIAEDASGMQGGSWYSSERTAQLLEQPEVVGRKAADYALRLLGARRVATQQCSVVFPPEVSCELVGNLLSAASGDAMYRNASMFAGKIGEQVLGKNISLVEDGTLVFERTLPDQSTLRVGGFGTAPFDGEGLRTRRTLVIERGILREPLLNTYTARQLHLSSNAKASRGLSGAPGIASGNYFLEPGGFTHDEIVGEVHRGLLVLGTMGFGVNLVTGDYSQGANGLWIENGEVAFPVEAITIAGNLKQMFQSVSAIGNDVEFRTASAVPTLRIEGMTVAGD